jgi:hypothetical protein
MPGRDANLIPWLGKIKGFIVCLGGEILFAGGLSIRAEKRRLRNKDVSSNQPASIGIPREAERKLGNGEVKGIPSGETLISPLLERTSIHCAQEHFGSVTIPLGR